MTASDQLNEDVLVGVQLFTASPREAGIYYEWLLELAAHGAPGEALAEIGAVVVAGDVAGVATGWSPVFRVDSAEKAVASIRAQGLHAVLEDLAEQRAVFDYLGARITLTDRVPQTSVGAAINVDFSASNVDAADRLLRSALGSQHLRVPGDAFDMRFLHRGRSMATGVFRLDDVAGSYVGPYWIIYFEVSDLVSFVTRAAASGSRVRVPPSRSPFNNYAVLEDPWGQVYGLSQLLDLDSIEGIPVVTDAGTEVDLRSVVDLLGHRDKG